MLGAKQTSPLTVHREHQPTLYVVTYQRFRGDALMSVRLDITVATTERIIGFTAR
ncbi:hypothetical protein AB0F77_15950 [Streptomyces sp. NPDC026672]|uniref:hypothetical protein n=1 Tax=unclassified Streptomyces TaxID=2593676 RepID=UPI0034061ECE